MSWQTWNKSWLIVVILCHSPTSDMLEFDFHVLILHLMSSYSCVNNPMHIEIYVLFYLRFLFLFWNSAMNCTCICMCVLYCLCWICALYCIWWICVLYWNVNIYFVINHYHFFVILQLELHVCIVLTFMFCEINVIIPQCEAWWAIRKGKKNGVLLSRTKEQIFMWSLWVRGADKSRHRNNAEAISLNVKPERTRPSLSKVTGKHILTQWFVIDILLFVHVVALNAVMPGQMAAIMPTMIRNVFTWIKIVAFWFQLH